MASIWHETVQLPEFPVLTEEIETEALVIGGGMAGVLTAYLLQMKGVDCVLLEANRVGGGVTGNTTAKITAQHGICYDTMVRQFGKELAGQYAKANLEALAFYTQIIADQNIHCDFQSVATHLYATKPNQALERECRAAEELGLPASMVDQCELPFPIWGALRFADQAIFHPLKFLAHIASKCKIYEQSRALEIQDGLVTTEGGRVRANHVVVATHFPFLNRPGYYFMRMHQDRSYVVALEHGGEIQDAYLGIDGAMLSIRPWGALTLLGGGGHRTGENESGGKYDRLLREAKDHFPDSQEVCRWSAQDCVSHDNIPYIGRYGSGSRKLYVATGFRKWGMTGSMAAAMRLSDLIVGIESPYTVFSPQRSQVAPSVKGLVEDGAESVAGLAKQIFHAPGKTPEDVAPGTAQVVMHRGKKMGIYRDPAGKAQGVEVTCSHLGCQLRFNADESSWDCPCHGSRFTCDGVCIDGPAQGDLQKMEGASETVSHKRLF